MGEVEMMSCVKQAMKDNGWDADYAQLWCDRERMQQLINDQRLTIKSLITPAEEVTGKQGSTAIIVYISRLETALEESEARVAELEHIEQVAQIYVMDSYPPEFKYDKQRWDRLVEALTKEQDDD